MLINVQSYPIDERSFIDVNTIQVNFKLAHASQYEVTNNGTKLRKIGGAPSDSRSCELISKPRPGKFFARVKFNNDGMYSVIAISNGLVNANNQLAWTADVGTDRVVPTQHAKQHQRMAAAHAPLLHCRRRE